MELEKKESRRKKGKPFFYCQVNKKERSSFQKVTILS